MPYLFSAQSAAARLINACRRTSERAPREVIPIRIRLSREKVGRKGGIVRGKRDEKTDNI